MIQQKSSDQVWTVSAAQSHAIQPCGLLCNVKAVFLPFISRSLDQRWNSWHWANFQTCTILSVSMTNHCAVFWHLISFKTINTNWFITGFFWLYDIVLHVYKTTYYHQCKANETRLNYCLNNCNQQACDSTLPCSLSPLAGQSGSTWESRRFPSLWPSTLWRRAILATIPAMWRTEMEGDRPTSSSPKKVSTHKYPD